MAHLTCVGQSQVEIDNLLNLINVEGIHLLTMNRPKSTTEILKGLKPQ